MHYMVAASPIGARRVRTDLNTSENIFIMNSTNKSNIYRTRTRTASPIVIKHQEEQPQHTYQQQNQQKDRTPHHHHHHHQYQHVHPNHHHHHHNHPHYQQRAQQHSQGIRTREPQKQQYFCGISDEILQFPTSARYPTSADMQQLSASAPNENATFLSAHLPARATRLLNRSRLQQQCNFNADSPDSAKSSSNSLRRGTPASSRASSNGSTQYKAHHQNSPHMQRSQRESLSSSDDLLLYDKSFRNAMIQDVLQFKKQLLRLRRILEETDTINPFDVENGQQVTNHCGFDLTKDADLISLISSSIDEPIEDISDMRRQVVYLQSQIDDRDRTIRLQRDLIEKLEAEKATLPHIQHATDISKECNNMATQTERTRPLSIGAEGLTRSKPEYTSYTTHFPAIYNDLASITHQHQQQQQQQPQHPSTVPGYNNGNYNSTSKALNQTRRHTIISTTLTNYNTQLAQVQPTAIPRRASMTWENRVGENCPTSSTTTVYKPVRITLIGDTLKQWNDELLALKNAEKLKMLNGNVGKFENFNRPQVICSNNNSESISQTKSDELANQMKANVVSNAKGGITIDDDDDDDDLAQALTRKCQRTTAVNFTESNTQSNGNHQNPTVTIV